MMRTSNTLNRPGIALVLALIAISVIGALITGIWAATALEMRADENSRRQNQAMAVAEAAAGEVVGNWNSGVWNLMAIGDERRDQREFAERHGTYTGTVTGGSTTSSSCSTSVGKRPELLCAATRRHARQAAPTFVRHQCRADDARRRQGRWFGQHRRERHAPLERLPGRGTAESRHPASESGANQLHRRVQRRVVRFGIPSGAGRSDG